MARFRMKFKKNISVGAVAAKLVATIFALYVGGQLINIVGQVMNGTCSPFYKGLTLIGWTVGSATCTSYNPAQTDANTITSTGGTGILSVVGLIGIASIVMEFVKFRM